ncbi:MAG: response regulator transcription factor [Thermoguttaceae bacterium]|jgi:two-component system OmpR family response regulator|nr:response regulator transcription factor [Thermoguttaceae bacterium]
MQEQPHVIVVEDEEHLAKGIKYNLCAEGYRVTTFGDGPAALRFLEARPDDVDLVVLDLMLPGMSGYSVCEAIRAERDTPVLILSARTLAEDRARGFDVGANQYLTKPFDLEEFLSRVRNLLKWGVRGSTGRAPAGRTPMQAAFGNAEINFNTFEVTVGGQPVRMTQLEMKLLRYFVEHEGRVIPRQELLEQVWGMTGNVQTRAPDQFMRRLRKTFEPDPANPRHFLTIRDAGYRFVGEPDEEA